MATGSSQLLSQNQNIFNLIIYVTSEEELYLDLIDELWAENEFKWEKLLKPIGFYEG